MTQSIVNCNSKLNTYAPDMCVIWPNTVNKKLLNMGPIHKLQQRLIKSIFHANKTISTNNKNQSNLTNKKLSIQQQNKFILS